MLLHSVLVPIHNLLLFEMKITNIIDTKKLNLSSLFSYFDFASNAKALSSVLKG